MLHLLLLLAFAAIAYYFYQANARKPAPKRSSDVPRSTLPTATPVSTARPQSSVDTCRTAVAPFAESVVSPHTAVAEIQTAEACTPTGIKWLKAETVKSGVEMKAMAEKKPGRLGVTGSTKNPPEVPPQAQTTPAAEVEMARDQQLPTTPTVTPQAAAHETAIQVPNATDSDILQVLQTMPSEEQRRVIEELIASTPPSKEVPTAGIPTAIEPKHELLPEAPMPLPSSAGPLAFTQPTLSEQLTQKPSEAVAPLIAPPNQSAQKSAEALPPSNAPHNDDKQASGKLLLKKIKKRTSIKGGKSDASKKSKKADGPRKSNKGNKGLAKNKGKKKAEASNESKKSTGWGMFKFGSKNKDKKSKRKSQQIGSLKGSKVKS